MKKTTPLLAIIITLILLAQPSFSTTMTSATYKISNLYDYGTTQSTSATYKLDIMTSQPLAGYSTSATYKLCLGYFCLPGLSGSINIDSTEAYDDLGRKIPNTVRIPDDVTDTLTLNSTATAIAPTTINNHRIRFSKDNWATTTTQFCGATSTCLINICTTYTCPLANGTEIKYRTEIIDNNLNTYTGTEKSLISVKPLEITLNMPVTGSSYSAGDVMPISAVLASNIYTIPLPLLDYASFTANARIRVYDGISETPIGQIAYVKTSNHHATINGNINFPAGFSGPLELRIYIWGTRSNPPGPLGFTDVTIDTKAIIALTSDQKGNITGTVTNTSGTQLDGVTITATSAAADIFTNITIANGEYTIKNANISTYTITAAKTGYYTETITNIDVNATEIAIADFVLTPTTIKGNITGTVTNTSGAQLDGVTITATSAAADIFTNITIANGEYTIKNANISTYTITAAKTGYYTETITNIDVNATEIAIADFVLTPTTIKGNITGTVTNTSGAQLDGVTITATSAAADIFTNTTNATGGYIIRNANISTYTITATKAGYNTETITNIDVNATESAIADFVLTPTTTNGNISGTITDTDGNPLDNVEIKAINLEAPGTYINNSDTLGKYTIHGMSISNYTVSASLTGYIQQSFLKVSVNESKKAILDFTLTLMPVTTTSEDTIAHFQTKEDITMQLGTKNRATIYIKNPTDSTLLVPLHIGSPDNTFKNFIQFKNIEIDRHNKNITLRPNEEKLIPITIYAGKIGTYELVVGPDRNYENKHDTKRITITNINAGIFAQSPGLHWTGFLILIILAATLTIKKIA